MASWYGYTGPESPEEYLEAAIFPTLMQGMEEMLQVYTVTERRKRFNPLDHLVAYLYRNNPLHTDREDISLADIPFVKEEWAINPRPPLPLSAMLTEEEAAIIIQKHYRGYLARKEDKAALFRTWQGKLWEERKAAKKITKFMRRVSTTGNVYKKEGEGTGGTGVVEGVSAANTHTKVKAEGTEKMRNAKFTAGEGRQQQQQQQEPSGKSRADRSSINTLEVNQQSVSREDHPETS